jgi:DNA-directed RNA polymerase specialized sigma24 family protein
VPLKRRPAEEIISSEEKIARLLALSAIKDLESQDAQAVLLRNVGFQNAEVAAMLGISENHVAVALYRGRNRKRPKKKAMKKR